MQEPLCVWNTDREVLIWELRCPTGQMSGDMGQVLCVILICCSYLVNDLCIFTRFCFYHTPGDSGSSRTSQQETSWILAPEKAVEPRAKQFCVAADWAMGDFKSSRGAGEAEHSLCSPCATSLLPKVQFSHCKEAKTWAVCPKLCRLCCGNPRNSSLVVSSTRFPYKQQQNTEAKKAEETLGVSLRDALPGVGIK